MGRVYEQAYTNEWLDVKRNNQTLECCDCCLVHQYDFRVRKGKIQIRVRRDNRATGQRRRRAGIKITCKHEPKRRG